MLRPTVYRRPPIAVTAATIIDDRRAHLKALVRSAPQLPGVYRWLDADGRLLYVGKAKNLRKRLQTYVRASTRLDTVRGRNLRERMAGLDLTVTDTELEALVLEMHLIRSLKPLYNVALTREEHFAYVRVTLFEDYPRVELVDAKANDGSRYFGPFTNLGTQRGMLRLLRTLYPFRTCSMGIAVDMRQGLFDEAMSDQRLAVSTDANVSPSRYPLSANGSIPLILTRKDRRAPCLDHHIGRCAGPCAGELTPAQYRARCIDGVLAFYGQDHAAVLEALIARMREAEGTKKFERAEDVRFALSFIEQRSIQKEFFDPEGISADIAGCDATDGGLRLVLLGVRGGKIVRESSATAEAGEPDAALTQFLVQHYDDERADAPPLLVLPPSYGERGLLRSWLTSRGRRGIAFDTPKRGVKQRLYDLALRNAEHKRALEMA